MKKLLSRLLPVLLIVVSLAAILVGSYIDIKSNQKSVKKTSKSVSSFRPERGGTVTIGVEKEPTTLNPFMPAGTTMATKLVTSNILWGLLAQTPQLSYAPRIAERVPTVENGLVTTNPFTVTYDIREDASWSDGVAITPEDVKFTWAVIMDPNKQIADRSGYDKILRIDTPYEKTVRIVFKEPYARYKELFTTYPILPKHKLEGHNIDQDLNDILSFASGPYRFSEWKHGDHLTLERNPGYWEKEPYLDKVVFKFIPKPAEQIKQLTKRKLDVIIPAFDKASGKRLSKLKSIKIDASTGLVWEQLGFNLSKPPLTEPNVRAAIAYAIDRRELSKAVLGIPEVLQSMIMPEQQPFYTPAWRKYTYNPTLAQQYLTKAGYHRGGDGIFERAGTELTVTLSTTAGDPSREAAARVLENDLERVGIRLKVRSVPASDFLNRQLPDGDFQMGLWAWFSDPELDLAPFFAANQVPPTGQNYYRYANPDVTQLLYATQTTLEQDKLRSAFRTIQEQISNDIVLIPLYQRIELIAYNNKVHGIINNTTLEGPLWNLNNWWIPSK
ncbi:MAG TPA: peptide ABC transporter substrate-binding protein [Candidatus Aquicultor sp.]